VDVPEDQTVVVSEPSETYHREPRISCHETACVTTFSYAVRSELRGQAEATGLTPCHHLACFGTLDGE